MKSKTVAPIVEIKTWERSTRPLSGVKLRKPRSITLKMLERWDVCYDAHAWFKQAVGARGYFPFDDAAIDRIFGKYTTALGFRTSWLIAMNNILLREFASQVEVNTTAYRVINKLRAEFNASVTASDLQNISPMLRNEEYAKLAKAWIKLINAI